MRTVIQSSILFHYPSRPLLARLYSKMVICLTEVERGEKKEKEVEEEVSKLVFYVQSRSVVISGR